MFMCKLVNVIKLLVVCTRKLAGTKLYKINLENPVVKKLIELNNTLCWEYTEEKKVVAV